MPDALSLGLTLPEKILALLSDLPTRELEKACPGHILLPDSSKRCKGQSVT